MFDNSIGQVQVKGVVILFEILNFNLNKLVIRGYRKALRFRVNTLRGFLSIPNEALVSCIEMNYHGNPVKGHP